MTSSIRRPLKSTTHKLHLNITLQSMQILHHPSISLFAMLDFYTCIVHSSIPRNSDCWWVVYSLILARMLGLVSIWVGGWWWGLDGKRTTYSWSRNREYSSSPTLTGDPPYCNSVSQAHLTITPVLISGPPADTGPFLSNQKADSPAESKPYPPPSPNN